MQFPLVLVPLMVLLLSKSLLSNSPSFDSMRTNLWDFKNNWHCFSVAATDVLGKTEVKEVAKDAKGKLLKPYAHCSHIRATVKSCSRPSSSRNRPVPKCSYFLILSTRHSCTMCMCLGGGGLTLLPRGSG